MTSRLSVFRAQLNRLTRARSRVRSAAAWSALAISVVVALAVVFALDLIFHLAVPQRLVVLALAAAGIGWSYWKFTRPLLGRAESEIETALLVERQHKIDSDLVAALQFESRQDNGWGSPQLATAVVQAVATVAAGVDVLAGLPTEQMRKRLKLLAACLAVAIFVAALWPGHVAAFVSRLALGSMHYPTRTRIERIIVSGVPVLDRALHGEKPLASKAAQGRALSFQIECSGRLPSSGVVSLSATGRSQGRTRITLKPLTTDAASGHTTLAGQLARLNDDLTYTITAGDAWTETALVEMIPQPIVELAISAAPPKYAASGVTKLDPAARQLAVLEGSSLDFLVRCTNGKPLKSVVLSLETSRGSERIELAPRDADRLVWASPAASGSLSKVHEELRYEVQAIDADGLSPQTPIRGTIRVRPDQAPTAAGQIVHKVVLPTAEPVVSYRVTDDHGISGLAIVVDIERVGIQPPPPAAVEEVQQPTDAPAPLATNLETHRFAVLELPGPIVGERLPLVGRYAFSLSPLKLSKGDRIKLTLEATDYRGENSEGQPTGHTERGESLVLEISDESGVLAAIAQPDLRSAEQLSEIIQRQLGIGEQP